MTVARTARLQNIVSALLFICIAASIIWLAIPLGVQEPKKVKFVALSPSYYPRLVGYCLLGVGVLLFFRSVFFRAVEKSDSIDAAATSRVFMLLPIMVVLFCLFWFLEQLGFVLAPSIAIVVLLLLAGERSWLAIILIAALLPMGLYLFFTQVANIPIPGGVLDPLLLRLQG